MRTIDDIGKNNQFAIILKCLLGKKNITQGQLAYAIGMSNATITNYIKGKFSPSQQTIEKIAKFLDVSPRTFFDDVERYVGYLGESKTIFSKRLSELMNEKEVTQGALAKKVGVSRQTINYYVNGKMMPTAEALNKIAKYFNVDTDYFMKEKDKEVQHMQFVVKEMPKSQSECLLADYRLCKFGGQCKLENGKCPYLITLADATEGTYITIGTQLTPNEREHYIGI